MRCFSSVYFFDDLLVYDHEELQWYEVGETSKWFDCLDDEFCEAIRIDAFRASMTEEEFKKAVSEAKSLISKGIIYQVNLSIRYQAKTRGNHSYEMYEALRNSSPAPMSAFARLGDHEVLSSSPELFLRMQGSEVITKPIKGTCPRESDLEVDRLMVEKLKNSEKEKAELLMITDLLRNDLGKVCELGSVKVHKLLEVESFAQVHHLCSEIRGSLKVEHVAALAASLPGGSITGAPKLSAMKAIESLEPVERGVYTGSLGFFGYNGISQFNLLIRSLVLQAETLSYSVGAGIVTDSDEQAEYVETQQKALGIRKALIHFLSEPEVLQNQGPKVKLNRAECY